MKVLITGANGFVGAALCRYFYKAGHTVIGLGRQAKPPAQLRQYADYISGDITQKLPALNADVCIHAAALTSDTAHYQDLYANNVMGTVQVLQAAVNCKFFIQISSSSVYAFGNQALPEQAASLKNKLTPYGTTKLLAERLLETQIPEGQHRLILRPRGIYGIGDRVLLPRLLRLVKEDKIYLPVPPTVQTSLTHVENIGYAISLFLQKQNQPPLQIFNVADEPVYNLRETIMRATTAVYQKPLKMIPVPATAFKLLVGLNKLFRFSPGLNPMTQRILTQNAILDITEIKKKLNYSPRLTFDQTVPDISQWITGLGGVDAYLAQKESAPWLIPDEKI
jgi:2-alkyl-3-oxoalkanoate reductase